jgi:alcohol dehydrogenase
MIDVDDYRLSVAKSFGASQVINSANEDAVSKVMSLTNGKGVDAAIEAVGVPATFELCEAIVDAGGHIANIGVHGKSVTLHLENLWSRNITITTRLVDTSSTPMLFKTLQSGKIEPKKLITHHFRLDQIIKAYETFGNAAKEKALKVILSNL